MAFNLLAEDKDIDVKIGKGTFTVVVNDGIEEHTIFEEENTRPLIIEKAILFNEGGFFEPWSGIGCYIGTNKSVDTVKDKLDI